MRKFLSATAVGFVASLGGVALGLSVDTPSNVVQCQPILVSYGNGSPPYFLTILPGGQSNAPPLKTWDATDATSTTWMVDIDSGTSITLSVKDNTGAQAYSDVITIRQGSNTNCQDDGNVGQSSFHSSGTSQDNTDATNDGDITSSSSGTSSRSSTSITGSSTASGGSRSIGPTGSPSPPRPTPQVVNPDNAALGASIHYGLAGLVGLMGAVIAVM